MSRIPADLTGRESQIRSSDKPPGAGSETSVYQQVKGFLTEAFEVAPAGGVPGIYALFSHRFC